MRDSGSAAWRGADAAADLLDLGGRHDSAYAAVVRLAREAETPRARFLRMVDRYAALFLALTPVITTVACGLGRSATSADRVRGRNPVPTDPRNDRDREGVEGTVAGWHRLTVAVLVAVAMENPVARSRTVVVTV